MIIKNSHIRRYFKMFKINSYLNIFYFIVKLYVQENKNKRLKIIIKLKKIKIKIWPQFSYQFNVLAYF